MLEITAGLTHHLVIVQAVIPEAAPVKVDRFQPLDGRRKREAKSEPRVKRAQGGLVVLVSWIWSRRDEVKMMTASFQI